jgi:hypothetical protein
VTDRQSSQFAGVKTPAGISLRIVLLALCGAAAAVLCVYFIAHDVQRSAETASAFLEELVFAEAVEACEDADHVTPFRYQGATSKAVIGFRRQPDSYDGSPMTTFRLIADGPYCDYHPNSKRAFVGVNP